MNRLLLDRLVLPVNRGEAHSAPLSAELEPGCHAWLLPRHTSLPAALAVVAGLKPAHRGRVMLDGKPLLATPSLRAQVGVLAQATDFEPLAKTAGSHFEQARRIRARAGIACHPEPRFLPKEVLDAPLSALEPEHQRLLQLEVALGAEVPRALVLADPLDALPAEVSDWLLEKLRRAQQDGTVCLIVSRERSKLTPFAQTVLGAPAQGAPGARTIELRVERPREIAARAQALPSVYETRLDARRPDCLQISGPDDDELVAALTRIVVECDCELKELTLQYTAHAGFSQPEDSAPSPARAGAHP